MSILHISKNESPVVVNENEDNSITIYAKIDDWYDNKRLSSKWIKSKFETGLMHERELARKNKDYKKSDSIRHELLKYNIDVIDRKFVRE